MIQDPQNSGRNRGFAFIEYYNNACAEYSRQKMSNSDFKLDDNAPTVSWADPKNAETAASAQVLLLELVHILSFLSMQTNVLGGWGGDFLRYLHSW